MKYVFTPTPELITVAFDGALTEGVQIALHDVTSRLPSQPVRIRFDMAGIRQVNSIGIREWLTFVRGIEKKHALVFAECPAEFMGFALMVPGIVGAGRVESFSCVFRCLTCRTTSVARLLGGEVRANGLGVRNCNICGSELESEVSDGPDLQAILNAAG